MELRRVWCSLAILQLVGCPDAPATSSEGGSSSDTTDQTTTTSSASSSTSATTSTATSGPEPTTTEATTGTTMDTTGSSTTGPGGLCGDGVADPGEACDDGPDNADTNKCTADCMHNVCGDGKVGPGEGCDDGNGVDGDDCNNACTLPTCGDGDVDRGEQCDDGNQASDDACTAACTSAVCGDGWAQPGIGEQCDLGPDNTDDGACTAACKQATCGDGLVWEVDDVEQCDHGPNNGPNKLCNAECQLNACGDGDVSPTEECDEGVNNGPGLDCKADCTYNTCGDGDKYYNEECDDGNDSNLDGCTTQCLLAVCGDGYKQPGEECDKGWNHNSNTGACTVACKLPACGDGFKQQDAGEICDDGNLLDGDGCSNNCQDKLEILQIHTGEHHSCVVVTGGRVKCWGRNDRGALGLGDTEARGDQAGEMGALLPFVDLGPMAKVTDLALGSSHTCALLDTGIVKCWGGNTYGQLGVGDVADRGDQPGEMGADLAPVSLSVTTVVDISAGADHTCAETQDGRAKCWGRNVNGELGLGDTDSRGDQAGEMGASLPYVDLGVGEVVVEVKAGARHNCAWLNNGKLKCWGLGGVLGLGDVAARGDEPGEMGNALPFVDLTKVVTGLASGGGGSCATIATNDNNALRCWGSNMHGQLGLGDTEDRGDEPGEMGAALPETDMQALVGYLLVGSQFGCVTVSDGQIRCWGRNDQGQLGVGHTASIGDEPGEMGPNIIIADLGGAQGPGPGSPAFALGASHSCAILKNNTVKCWGHNGHGELGLGDTENRGDAPDEMGEALPAVKLITDWF